MNTLQVIETYGPGLSSEALVSECKCSIYAHTTVEAFRQYVRDYKIPYYPVSKSDVRFRWSEVRAALSAHGALNLPATAEDGEREREREARSRNRMARRVKG